VRTSLPIAVAGDMRFQRGETVMLGIRPHDIALVSEPEADAMARVSVVEPLGNELHVHAISEAGDTRLIVVASADASIAPGDRIGLRLRRDRLHIFRRL
jgi:multiple sugar transport system ATP-binding protein